MDILKLNQFLGEGHACGYGDIKNINRFDVYNIDNIPTIFTHIRGNIAKGYLLERNTILKPYYIVRAKGYFAHGETLSEAQSALEVKVIANANIEEKIKYFKIKFPNVNKKYAAKDFYRWYHNLTGSCELGRKPFVKTHNIDINNDVMTVKEFILLSENSYPGDIIKRLKASYGCV